MLARAGHLPLYNDNGKEGRKSTAFERRRTEAAHEEVLGGVLAVLRSESWDSERVCSYAVAR